MMTRPALPSATTLNVLERAGFAGVATALVLGSGLKIGEPFAVQHQVAYRDIPGFPTTSVLGHKGALSRVRHPAGAEFLVMEGRPHLYEGWTQDEVAFPVRLLHALGVRRYVVTNAAGGLSPDYRVGEFVGIRDHLSFLPASLTLSPTETERFAELQGTTPYTPALLHQLTAVWPAPLRPLQRGVYAAVLGPNYETPAEVRMLRMLGADLVGMSSATEVSVAAILGMEVLGLSLVSNSLAHPSTGPLTHTEVIAAGAVAARQLTAILECIAGL